MINFYMPYNLYAEWASWLWKKWFTILYNIQCILLCNVQCILLYNVKCILLYDVHCTLYSIHYCINPWVLRGKTELRNHNSQVICFRNAVWATLVSSCNTDLRSRPINSRPSATNKDNRSYCTTNTIMYSHRLPFVIVTTLWPIMRPYPVRPLSIHIPRSVYYFL